MRQQCIQAVAQAIGRALTQVEVREIEKRLYRNMRALARKDPAAWMAKSKADRLNEAAKAAGQELIDEQALKQERAALAVLAHDRISQHIADQGGRGIDAIDALDRVIAFHADGRSNFISIETQSRAIERDALRQMIGTLTASNPKWFGLFENHEGIRAIVKEIFGESSGNAEAARGAKEWKRVTDALRERFNRGGGDVGELEDWGLPHHHAQMQVAKAGRQKWVADTLPLLDRDHYYNEDGTRMTDAQLAEFLGHAWTTIATGGANKVTPGQPGGAGMRANRGSESRQVHFKDADSYLKYQEAYGERSLYEVLTGHIQGVAKDIALVETFGPNPDHAFKYWRDKSLQDAKIADPTKTGRLDERAVRTENLYNVVAGKTQPVASERLANTFDTLRSWLVASRLGSAVITSFSDEATLHLTGRLNHLPQFRLLANELAAFNPANRMEERLALRAGLAMQTLVSSLNRFGQDALGASFSKKLATTVLRASGLNAMTEARRRAFGVTMMSSLGSVVKSHASLSRLDPSDHRILLSKGITAEDFAVWKFAQLEDWGGGNNTMLTPESIYRIPDARLSPSLGFGADPRTLKERAATKLLGVVLEESDVAVIEPGAKDRLVTGAGMQRGTWKGELTRSFFLFKSFPLAMISRHWARGMSLPNAGGKAAYLATLVAATTAAGMVSLQVNELLQGRDPRNMNPAEKGGVRNWIAAMLKGGSLGIYGDFLFSEATQHGRSPLAAVAGPLLGTAEDVLGLTQGNIMQAAQGKDANFGAELVRFAKGTTPGASLWYAKGALDHLIFQRLQEYFSPGYLRKMRQRSEREFGQSYFWEPGEPLPERAPDPAAAVGE
jgi:hypothetical protein